MNEIQHLNTEMLASRWGMSRQTLANQRSLGQGPPYVKLGAHVVYRLEDIEEYEEGRIVRPVQ